MFETVIWTHPWYKKRRRKKQNLSRSTAYCQRPSAWLDIYHIWEIQKRLKTVSKFKTKFLSMDINNCSQKLELLLAIVSRMHLFFAAHFLGLFDKHVGSVLLWQLTTLCSRVSNVICQRSEERAHKATTVNSCDLTQADACAGDWLMLLIPFPNRLRNNLTCSCRALTIKIGIIIPGFAERKVMLFSGLVGVVETINETSKYR